MHWLLWVYFVGMALTWIFILAGFAREGGETSQISLLRLVLTLALWPIVVPLALIAGWKN